MDRRRKKSVLDLKDRCFGSSRRKAAFSSAVLSCLGLRPTEQAGWCPPTWKKAICSALSIDLNGDLLQKCHQRCLQIILVIFNDSLGILRPSQVDDQMNHHIKSLDASNRATVQSSGPSRVDTFNGSFFHLCPPPVVHHRSHPGNPTMESLSFEFFITFQHGIGFLPFIRLSLPLFRSR